MPKRTPIRTDRYLCYEFQRQHTSKSKKKTRGRKDSNQSAFDTVQKTIEASEADAPRFDTAIISEVMRQLGSKGGKIGGVKRMEVLSPEEKTQLALKAAKARWAIDKRQKG